MNRPRTPDRSRELLAIVQPAQAGNVLARTHLVDRLSPTLLKLLRHVLGPDPELADVLQETFAEIFRQLPRLRDPSAIMAWSRQIAVTQAHLLLRRRHRRRWLRFFAPEAVPQTLANDDPRHDQAVRELYLVLETIPPDERVAFVLRYVEQLDLTEVASTCAVSLATAKRRIAYAKAEVLRAAEHYPHLAAWLLPEAEEEAC